MIVEILSGDSDTKRNEIALLIAVTTACSTREHQNRRQAIRQTWKQDALLNHQVNVLFFFGASTLRNDFPLRMGIHIPVGSLDDALKEDLQQEMKINGDIVLVRGSDDYSHLSDKTLGIMKYMLSSNRYTHLMKTDDDVYIRIEKLLNIMVDDANTLFMTRYYKGCIENPNGFKVQRDVSSKWYFSDDVIDEETAENIKGTLYYAGWGYLLSRDLVYHVMKKVDAWNRGKERAPSWHGKLRECEDVMTGLLLSDVAGAIQTDRHFKAAWHVCTPETAVC